MFDSGWDYKNLKVKFTPELPFPPVQLNGRILCFGVATRQITLTSNTNSVPAVVTTTASTCTSTNTCSPGCTGTETCTGTLTEAAHVETQTNITTEEYTIAYCFDQQGIVYPVLPGNIVVFHTLDQREFSF